MPERWGSVCTFPGRLARRWPCWWLPRCPWLTRRHRSRNLHSPARRMRLRPQSPLHLSSSSNSRAGFPVRGHLRFCPTANCSLRRTSERCGLSDPMASSPHPLRACRASSRWPPRDCTTSCLIRILPGIGFSTSPTSLRQRVKHRQPGRSNSFTNRSGPNPWPSAGRWLLERSVWHEPV